MHADEIMKQPAVYIVASRRNGTLYVGVEPFEIFNDSIKRLARHVRRRDIADADATIGDRRSHAAREFGARFRAQHDEPRHFVEFGFGAQRRDRTDAKHDADRIGVVGEGSHLGPLFWSFRIAAQRQVRNP